MGKIHRHIMSTRCMLAISVCAATLKLCECRVCVCAANIDSHQDRLVWRQSYAWVQYKQIYSSSCTSPLRLNTVSKLSNAKAARTFSVNTLHGTVELFHLLREALATQTAAWRSRKKEAQNWEDMVHHYIAYYMCRMWQMDGAGRGKGVITCAHWAAVIESDRRVLVGQICKYLCIYLWRWCRSDYVH